MGKEQSISLLHFFNGNPESINTTYALGSCEITLQSEALGGIVKVSNNYESTLYDWNYDSRLLRNALIFEQRFRYGLSDSHGFPLIIYGTGLLNQ